MTNNPTVEGISPTRPDPVILNRAAEILRNGGLVVAPTETRYGLLGRADRPRTVETVYRIKQRSPSLPCALFVSSASDMSRFGIVPASAQHLASRYLPGPLTLVLEAVSDLKPPLVVDSRIGLRVSSSSIIQGLLSMVSFPLTATSANISGAKEPDSITSVVEAFGHHVDLYLDGGVLREAVSTVVDCYGRDVKILREGAISRSAIEACLGELPS